VGRDHAGPGSDKNGKPFYDPYAAQELVTKYQDEIGIKILPFSEVMYDKKNQRYLPVDQVTNNHDVEQISGTQFRKMLRDGDEIPIWFSFPDVIAELRKVYPPKYKQGFTLFLTGLSGAGKSTTANALMQRLHEYCSDRSITLLDGDIVRTLLSSKLSFSKEDRNLNIHRIAYVASEITRHNGIVICAPIAPYAEARFDARKMIDVYGGFFEIYINTPLSECRARDPKGLYKKVDAGLIKNFTGVDDPYEPPMDPDIEIRTPQDSVETAVEKILQVLCETGYIANDL
jgi:sulfate adenylyltransferase